MSLMISQEADIKQLGAGLYTAVCCAVIDIGTQMSTDSFGTKLKNKVVLCFEIKDERIRFIEDDVEYDLPLLKCRVYTKSLYKQSALRKELQSWRGRDITDEEAKEFDLRKLLGVNCQINVVISEKGYPIISGILPPTKGMPKLVAERPLVVYDIENDGLNIPKSLPKFIVDMILDSKEIKELYNKIHGSDPIKNNDGAEDMPF